jgi:hypothetical protein
MNPASPGSDVKDGRTTTATPFETKITEWRSETGTVAGLTPTVRPAPMDQGTSLEGKEGMETYPPPSMMKK